MPSSHQNLDAHRLSAPPPQIRILISLNQRKERFDHVIIETTGLADPAPVAQVPTTIP